MNYALSPFKVRRNLSTVINMWVPIWYLCVRTVAIDGFHSICHHRNWMAKVSCDVDINQSTGSMVCNALQLPSEKMLWNPSITGSTVNK